MPILEDQNCPNYTDKLEMGYSNYSSENIDEFRNKKGGGDHQDFYYDPNKFSKPGKNYHGVIPGDNKMGIK